jgi:hypothetical protein
VHNVLPVTGAGELSTMRIEYETRLRSNSRLLAQGTRYKNPARQVASKYLSNRRAEPQFYTEAINRRAKATAEFAFSL